MAKLRRLVNNLVTTADLVKIVNKMVCVKLKLRVRVHGHVHCLKLFNLVKMADLAKLRQLAYKIVYKYVCVRVCVVFYRKNVRVRVHLNKLPRSKRRLVYKIVYKDYPYIVRRRVRSGVHVRVRHRVSFNFPKRLQRLVYKIVYKNVCVRSNLLR